MNLRNETIKKVKRTQKTFGDVLAICGEVE